MKHYHATWAHDRPDDPVWMAYEVTDDARVSRLIEHFALGWTDYREAAEEDRQSLIGASFDPAAFADDTMILKEITPDWFAGLWNKRDAS